MSKIAHPDAKTPISAIEFSSNNDLFQSILYKLKSILLIANTKNTKIDFFIISINYLPNISSKKLNGY
jgi:hypothetical protein